MVVHLDELAIQAVADADGRFERLDVNVGSPQTEGLGEGLEHQPDDRGIVAVGTRFGVAGGDGQLVGWILFRNLDPVDLAEVNVDVLGGGADDVDFPPDHMGQAVEHLEIERIDDGDG